MNIDQIFQTILIYALPVLFAITLHEAAHAYAAKYFGDATAYLQGRMSLNPAKHIDPLGTIFLPLLMYIVTQGSFLFGYAKPVPVIYNNLRKPKRDMALVALAGPLANAVMAILWAILGTFLLQLQITEVFFIKMAQAGIIVNIAILAFNLLPILPLDGGRIMIGILPMRAAAFFARIEPYGFFIVVALAALQLLSYWLIPIMTLALQILAFFFPSISLLMTSYVS